MFEIECERPWLVARFAEAQVMLSWSMNRPGLQRSREVAWLEVGNEELRYEHDPAAWFGLRLRERGLADAIGLMTARDLSRHHRAAFRVGDVGADCVVTLGLNNGEHVGRRLDPRIHALNAPGTINILCAVSVPLSQGALMETMSLATQARTVALMDIAYRRPGEQHVVTGTGTDCIVVSSPEDAGAPHLFAGMHTAIGEAVGRSVYDATFEAARSWWAERG